MTDDLVKRLREFWMTRFALWGTGTKSEFESDKLHQEAADRIETLEAALREIIQEDALTGKTVFVGDFGKIAIAALKEKE